MFQFFDLRDWKRAGRFEGQDAFDPAALHRRELRALLRQERRARWAALRRRH